VIAPRQNLDPVHGGVRETTFRVYGATAIATGRLRRTRVVAAATVDDDWRFTKVYLQRAGRWQVVSFHASNVAP
jgi:Domain of unknown function (DUF4440)